MEILEDKDSPPDLECCLDPDDDDDTTIPSVKLNEAINLRDLQNEGGTMFEVQENPGMNEICHLTKRTIGQDGVGCLHDL